MREGNPKSMTLFLRERVRKTTRSLLPFLPYPEASHPSFTVYDQTPSGTEIHVASFYVDGPYGKKQHHLIRGPERISVYTPYMEPYPQDVVLNVADDLPEAKDIAYNSALGWLKEQEKYQRDYGRSFILIDQTSRAPPSPLETQKV